MQTLPELLQALVQMEGSDLHLSINSPPQVRVHGELTRLPGTELTASETKQLAYSVLADSQKKRFEETLELGGTGLHPRVLPAYRGRGVGTALYEALETYARERGFIEAGTMVVDEGSLAFADRKSTRLNSSHRT